MDKNEQSYPGATLQSTVTAQPVVNLRTYMSDVARLIRENQLTDKELSKIDPTFVEAAKRNQIPTTVTPRTRPAPREDQYITHVKPGTTSIPVVNTATGTESTQKGDVIDFDVVGKSAVKEGVVAQPVQTPSPKVSDIPRAPVSVPTPPPQAKKLEIKATPPVQKPTPDSASTEKSNTVFDKKDEYGIDSKKEELAEEWLKKYASDGRILESRKDILVSAPKPSQPTVDNNTVSLTEVHGSKPIAPNKPVIKHEIPTPPPIQQPVQQAIKPQVPPVQKPENNVVKLEVKSAPKPVKALPRAVTPEERFKKEEEQYQSELQKVQLEEATLKDQEINLQTQKSQVALQAERLKMQERDAERKETEILQKKNSASAQEQAELAKQRWGIEDERQQFEKQRWAIDTQILDFEKRINEVIAQSSELKKHEETIQGNIDIIRRQELALKAQADRAVFTGKLNEVKKVRIQYETEWQTLMKKKEQAIETYTALERKEKSLQQQIETIESKEHTAASAVKVHEYEAERWLKDHELRDTEKEKWKEADDISSIENQIKELEQKTQDVLVLEKQTLQKVAEVDLLIRDAEQAYKQR